MKELVSNLKAGMIERNDEADIMVVSLVAQEHVLLVGPPGTGKSMLLDGVMDHIEGEKFSVLFSKFTTPEEVFGPLSLAQLKKDRFVRVSKGMLQEAVGAFGDEIFKASSAILNTLLRILNEREYIEEGVSRKCPLRTFVGASNEWPQGEELGALYDRFLLRKEVKNISGRKKDQLLFGSINPISAKSKIRPEELDKAHTEAMSIGWSEEAKKGMREIVNTLASEGIMPGDRRLRKCTKAVKAKAYLAGRTEVENEDLIILKDCAWVDPSQANKCSAIVRGVASPGGAKIAEIEIEFSSLGELKSMKDPKETTARLAKLNDLIKRAKEINTGEGKELAKTIESEARAIKIALVENM